MCKRDKIEVDGADDDSRMIRSLAVKLHEMSSVKRQNGSLVYGGGVKNILVTDTLPRLAGLVNCQYFVPECA